MKAIIAILVILFSGIYIYIYWQSHRDLNSGFNQTTRFQIGKKPWARKLWALHNDGDARAQYLLGSEPMIVEIVRPDSIDFHEELNTNLRKKLGKILGRPVQTFSVDFIKQGNLTEDDIENIVHTKQRHNLPDQPHFFIILADSYEGEGLELGKTYQEFGMLLSNKRLKEVSADLGATSVDQYMESTILHEFGHQIGLPHNQDEDCIMNEKVAHADDSGFFSGIYTPTDYCALEVTQITQLRDSLR